MRRRCLTGGFFLSLIAGNVAAARGAPVLTVADVESAGRNGAMIERVAGDEGVRFDINAMAARKAGLQITSRLLRLARRVY